MKTKSSVQPKGGVSCCLRFALPGSRSLVNTNFRLWLSLVRFHVLLLSVNVFHMLLASIYQQKRGFSLGQCCTCFFFFLGVVHLFRYFLLYDFVRVVSGAGGPLFVPVVHSV